MEIEIFIVKKVEIADVYLQRIREITEDGSIGARDEAIEYVMKLRADFDHDTAKAIVAYVDEERSEALDKELESALVKATESEPV